MVLLPSHTHKLHKNMNYVDCSAAVFIPPLQRRPPQIYLLDIFSPKEPPLLTTNNLQEKMYLQPNLFCAFSDKTFLLGLVFATMSPSNLISRKKTVVGATADQYSDDTCANAILICYLHFLPAG